MWSDKTVLPVWMSVTAIKRKTRAVTTGRNRHLLHNKQQTINQQKRPNQMAPILIIRTATTAVSDRTGIITGTIRIKGMKAARKLLFAALPLLVMLFLNGCTDPNAIIDQNTPIENHNWSYANRIKNSVKIDDASIPYN